MSVKDMFSSAGQKAKDITEVTKLKANIFSAEKQLNDLYDALGRQIYAAYSADPLPEAADCFAQIKAVLDDIDAWQTQINTINAGSVCPQCGASISKGMVFCSSCGFKLPVVETPVTPQKRFCSACGAENPDGAMFCAICGNKLI